MAAACGSVGRSLLAAQRSDIAKLFSRVCASDETERDGLPRRCDRQWFADTFCSESQELPVSTSHASLRLPASDTGLFLTSLCGETHEVRHDLLVTENVRVGVILDLQGDSATEEEIWASIDRLACHAPLAVLACVPNFLRRYTAPSLQLTVLSAEHSVVRPHIAMPIRHNLSCGCVLLGVVELTRSIALAWMGS